MLDDEQQISFAELWTNAQPAIRAYVHAIVRDQDTTRDIVQNTAILVLKKFESWDSSREFLPWALGFAKFEILAYRRDIARNRIVFNDEILESMTELWPNAMERVEPEQSVLLDCLEKLDRKSRNMIDLRYFHDLKIIDVAERVGSSSGAVRVALMRIRRLLEECVQSKLKKMGDHQ